MGFHSGLRALFFITIFVHIIRNCESSKITFPNLDDDNSPTKSTIVTATPTPSSSSREAIFGSDSDRSYFYSIRAGDKNSIDEENNEGSSESLGLADSSNNNNGDEQVGEAKGFVRSLEIPDSRELYDPDRRLKHEMDGRWNYDEKNRNQKWRPPPDEKTIALQIVDEDPYHHGRPAWPHDEYLVGYFDLKTAPQRNNQSSGDGDSTGDNFDSNLSPDEIRKFYEWKRLQPARPPPSAFIGPGFYDVSSLSPSSSADNYRYQQPSYHAISTEGTGKIQSTGSGSSGSSNTEGDGSVPGTPSESTTNTRHFPAYQPYDLYKRKRLRLQIHPGLIAAPLAGLAAFGAASALTSKPLLVELGYVRNKPELIGGGGFGGIPGGWGWAGTPVSGGYRPYPPFYPPPNPPPILPPIGVGTGSVGHYPNYPNYPHYPIGGGLGGVGGGLGHAHASTGGGAHGHGGGGAPIYPILKPIRHKPESERSNWWNPFSALTPRLLVGPTATKSLDFCDKL